jgi:flagellar M-ring protein FliF
VRVEVNAELDNTIQEETRGVKPDKNAVDSRETTSLDESTQAVADEGGRPGLVSQGPNRQIGGVGQPQQQSVNKTKSETTDTQKVVGVEETKIVRQGLTPKEVWATVTIPARYVEGVWKQRNPTATDPPKVEDLRVVRDDVIRIVENIVEPLLLQESIKAQDTYKHVRVEVVDSLPAPTIEPPSTVDTAIAWTGRYWSTLAMLGVAIFSLMVLRSVVKGAGAPPADSNAAAATPTLTLHADEAGTHAEGSDDEEESERPRLRLKKGKSLKDDLIEIVRDDPESAADILRSWIGKAG